MQITKQTPIFKIALSAAYISLLSHLTGCSTTDKYHNKKHVDTIKKDISSIHKDIDRAFGIDEPSPLVEKE